MGIIVRNKKNEIHFFIKGADTVMRDFLEP